MLYMFRKNLLFIIRRQFTVYTAYGICHASALTSGPGSSVGIANRVRVERSGDRIPVEATFSVPIQTGPGAHTASCTLGTGSLPGVKSGRGMTMTPHPLLVPLVKKE
jgi:hypothetical protein